MGRLGILFNIGGIFSAAVLKHFAALPSLRRFRGERGGGVASRQYSSCADVRTRCQTWTLYFMRGHRKQGRLVLP